MPSLHPLLACTAAVAFLLTAGALAQQNYWQLLHSSNNLDGAGCAAEIDLRRTLPHLTYQFKAKLFSNFILRRRYGSQFFATYTPCTSGQRHTYAPDRARAPDPDDNDEADDNDEDADYVDDRDSGLLDNMHMGQFALRMMPTTARRHSSCSEHHTGPTIVVARHYPLSHFGHQMLTIVPALTALKLHLAFFGIDATAFPVLLADMMGPFESSSVNARIVLEALGFKTWRVACPSCVHWSLVEDSEANTTVCVDKAIVLSHGFYGKRYQDHTGALRSVWESPASLMDTDPVMMHIVEAVRLHFHLPATLPFAPTHKHVIVVGSRSASLRMQDPALKGKVALKRVLINEEELVDKLAALPDVQVKQVDFGTLSFYDMLTLMANTSVFVGYHGSAFENVPFMARGGWLLEIMPSESPHEALYPNKAHMTGKFAIRYYNDDPTRQTCMHQKQCHPHDMSLDVDISAVVDRVMMLLKLQKWQLDKSRA